MSVWSPWINFFKLYDFYGLVNNKFPSDRKNIISWHNNKGKVLTDNGFRLRSKIYQRGSFKNLKPKISLKSIECNLNSKDIGVYCLRIIYPPYQTFNYIGMSAKTSIHERLLHHFIKISGTTEFAGGRHGSDTEEFIKMRSYFKTKGIDTSKTSFFDKVEISFIDSQHTNINYLKCIVDSTNLTNSTISTYPGLDYLEFYGIIMY